MFRSLKILQKITLAYVLFIIIPLLFITAISYYQFYQKEKSSILINEKAELNTLISTLTTQVTTVENISTNILKNTRLLNYLNSTSYTKAYTSKEFQESTTSIFEYSLLLHKLSFHSVKLFLLDDRITQYDDIIHSEKELVEQSWYKDFISSTETSIWVGPIGIGYLVGEEKNTRPVYSYCQKLITDNGAYGGIIVLSITQDKLLNQLLITSNKTTAYHVVDSLGKTVISTDKSTLSLSSPELEKIKNQDYYIYTEKAQLTMWKYLPELNQFVGISQQLENPLFLKSDKLLFMGVVSILLISILFIFYYYIKQIFNEINKKIQEVDTIVKHNFEGRIETTRQDEIGEISQSFNILIDTIHVLIKDVVAKEIAQKDANLMALQYQINPHFIYNTIEVFSTSMELSGSYEIADAMAAFGKMLRYNLKNESNFSTIKEEIEHVKSYINIEKIKYFDQLHLTINCEEELYTIPIIRFLLQPIVENSITHGFVGKATQKNVELRITQENSMLFFCVIDDGIGIDEEQLIQLNTTFTHSIYSNKNTDQHGIGLRNINERLKLFYGETHHLSIDCRENQTLVSFSIPL